MKLDLLTTTLICVDCVDKKSVNTSIKVLERCKALCNFSEVKLLTSIATDYEHKIEIAPIRSLVHYSLFVLKRIHEFVDTKHLLIVQGDGWILNPESWDNEWLGLDYIGALFNQYDNPPIMGVGGFSFRSKALMREVSSIYPAWTETEESTNALQNRLDYYEDGVIAMGARAYLEKKGFKFATVEQGARFSAGGNPNNKYHIEKPFGIHGSWRAFDQHTGIVSWELKYDGFVPHPI